MERNGGTYSVPIIEFTCNLKFEFTCRWGRTPEDDANKFEHEDLAQFLKDYTEKKKKEEERIREEEEKKKEEETIKEEDELEGQKMEKKLEE